MAREKVKNEFEMQEQKPYLNFIFKSREVFSMEKLKGRDYERHQIRRKDK